MGVQDRDWYIDAIRQRERSAQGNASQPRHGSRAVACWLAVAVIVFAAAYGNRVGRARGAADGDARVVHQDPVPAEQRYNEDAARRQTKQAELDGEEFIRVQALRERQRAEEQATQSAAAEAVRKQHTWDKFYRPTAFCNETGTVECANAFIRAKRLFEREYAHGAQRTRTAGS